MMTRSAAFALFLSAATLPAMSFAQDTTEADTSTEAPAETTTEAPAEAPAEEAPATADPADTLDMGTPVDENGNPVSEGPAAGEPYVRESHGDWEIRCLNNPEGPDPCQMYQLLRDAEDNPVAEIALFPLPEDSRAAAGANIVAPLETYLPAQLTMSVDGGTPRKYPFTFCSGRPFSPFLSNGCVSRVGFDAASIDQFRRGAAAKLILVPAVAPDQTIELNVSLTGFTAAFEAQSQPAAE